MKNNIYTDAGIYHTEVYGSLYDAANDIANSMADSRMVQVKRVTNLWNEAGLVQIQAYLNPHYIVAIEEV
ncbi:MAG: hypothetical protein R3330_09295 [Saprospiraceae bacterium]|nr:hypothetical protein [Saprospiraceae bacterium]